MGFAGLRVLELGSLASASWCGRLFADFGADVLKLEPGDGDPLRADAPRFGKAGAEESAAFAFLNFGKRIAREGAADLSTLLRDCDVLILGDCAAPAAVAENASLIVIDASWFGASGPYKDHVATDATVRALAGLVQLVGSKDGPPLQAADFQAGYVAGLWAFIAACAGLMARARDDGRRFEASVFEACVTLTEYQVAEAAIRNEPQQRSGIGRFAPTYPLGVYRASDGWIGATMVTPAQWRGFCEMLGLPDIGAAPHFTTGLERLPHADELEAQFAPRLAEMPAAHWFAEGLKRRLPIVVVPEIESLASSPEFRARGAIATIRDGDKTLYAPASPLRLVGAPPATEATLSRGADAPVWNARAAAPHFATPAARKGALPLAGFRIVDFTMGWAGPLCARTLADLGADVIKIEGCSYPDWWRGVDRRPNVLREKLYEKTGRFSVMNRNKRGIAIDLTRPEGARLARALVARADAVVENYSVEVLPKLGLSPASLRAENAKLVTLSMSAFGASSPWRDCRAYGSTLEQGSGLPRLLGRPGDPPVMGHPAFGDPVGGLAGMAAMMAALLHARRTGEGQHIDLSQVECMMQMVGPWMLAHSADGTLPQRSAGRHPDHAPSGVYACAGEEAWISIAVTDDAAWARLAALLGRADLAQLRERAARLSASGEIDAALSAWTRARSPDAAMEALQAIGVACGVARQPLDLLRDPHLTARDYWQWTDRAFIGRHAQPAAAVRDQSAPYPVRWPSPTLGEYNRAVLSELLGLSDAEIDQLARAGVIGDQLVVAADGERGAA